MEKEGEGPTLDALLRRALEAKRGKLHGLDSRQNRVKLLREDEVEEERCTKAKRYDVEIPMADVDIKLAEKLDSILKIGDSRKPKFSTNKPKVSFNQELTTVKEIKRFTANHGEISTASKGIDNNQLNNSSPGTLKPRNLTKEELRERLIKKYDTLVPELDPKRPNVRVVKILSANESIELGKSQARKQMERQLELNSVSGNQLAHRVGLSAFRFNDGYGMPEKSSSISEPHSILKPISNRFKQTKPLDEPTSTTKQSSDQASKLVRFANEDETNENDDIEGDEELSNLALEKTAALEIFEVDSTESDCSTGDDDDDDGD